MPGNASSGRPSEKYQLPVEGNQEPPEMPDDLDGEHAKKLWKVAVESLPHVLRPIDGPVLHLCCLSFQSAIDLANEGDHKMAIAFMRAFELLACKIGLTPHARRVIKPVAPKQEFPDDPFIEWMSRRGLS